MPQTSNHTYRALYEEGCARLSGHPDAKIDARILLEEVCDTNMQTLLLEPMRPVSEDEAARYRSYIDRRLAHEPVAYIIGHWAFMGLDYLVTPDVLIPEQDTETLVELALEEIPRLQGETPFRVLDLCTGSGCIVTSTLKLAGEDRRNKVTFQGVGADISEAALGVARENGKRIGVNEQMTWVQGDLFEALKELPERERQFDLVLTNPPYIAPKVIETLAPEVRDAEPRLALDGGEDGLDFYRRIAAGIRPYLKNRSSIIVETGFDEAPDVQKLFEAQGFTDIRIYQDMGGLERGLLLRTS